MFSVPFLAEGIRITETKSQKHQRPFHERMEACFRQLKEKVEKQYERPDHGEWLAWQQSGGTSLHHTV